MRWIKDTINPEITYVIFFVGFDQTNKYGGTRSRPGRGWGEGEGSLEGHIKTYPDGK